MPKPINGETFAFADEPTPEIEQPTKEPAQKLLEWLLRWNRSTVSISDLLTYGPRAVRPRDLALSSAQTLVEYGWLQPLETRCRNQRQWKILRQATLHPSYRQLAR